MAETYDPYHRWLGISPKDQPPNHYRLLGIDVFEPDPDVIDNAAYKQMAHVRTFQLGKHSALSQKILNELAAAKVCLLMAAKRAEYDARLREEIAAAEGQTQGVASDGPPNLKFQPAALHREPVPDRPRRPRKTRLPWQVPAVVGAGLLACVAIFAYLIATKPPEGAEPGEQADASTPPKKDAASAPSRPGAGAPLAQGGRRQDVSESTASIASPGAARKSAERPSRRVRIRIDAYRNEGSGRELSNAAKRTWLPGRKESWDTIDQPLRPELLRDADILIATHCGKPKDYTPAERQAVVDFVEGGGSVLITALTWVGVSYGKYSEADYPPNQIGTRFGLLMTASYAANPARFATHPITDGLAGLDWSRDVGTQSGINVSDGAVPLIYDSGQHVLCAVREYGKGRVCMMSPTHAVHAVKDQNPEYVRLLQQVLRWLARGADDQ